MNVLDKVNADRGTRINDAIRVKEVRVIAEDGQQMGIIPTREAIRIAQDMGLDLVEVNPMVKPPVCKIMDFGKFKYEQKQKIKSIKKNQTTIEIKEMKFRPSIEQHDFDTKVSHIKNFLAEGNKCIVVLMFRGREMTHIELGKAVLDRVVEALKGLAIVENSAKLDGRNMSMVLAPVKK